MRRTSARLHPPGQDSPGSSSATPPVTSSEGSKQTYLRRIRAAILASPTQQLTVQEIYHALEGQAGFLTSKEGGEGWKNTVRNILSLSPTFKKLPGESARTSFWAVDEEAPDIFVRDRTARAGSAAASSSGSRRPGPEPGPDPDQDHGQEQSTRNRLHSPQTDGPTTMEALGLRFDALTSREAEGNQDDAEEDDRSTPTPPLTEQHQQQRNPSSVPFPHGPHPSSPMGSLAQLPPLGRGLAARRAQSGPLPSVSTLPSSTPLPRTVTFPTVQQDPGRGRSLDLASARSPSTSPLQPRSSRARTPTSSGGTWLPAPPMSSERSTLDESEADEDAEEGAKTGLIEQEPPPGEREERTWEGRGRK